MSKHVAFLATLLAVPAFAQPLYLTIVSHNEEPNARHPDYLREEFYRGHREVLRKFALLVKSKGAMWDLQSDWNFLSAVAKYDTGETTANTNGKNILRWIVEDLGFAADPHAHESKYNYADVAYLHTKLGVTPSKVVGGFLFYPPDNPQGWEQHEKGIQGRVFPDYFWQAEILWGAATGMHRGNDERSHGIWHPKDKTNFIENDPSRRLVYIAGDCYTWGGLPAMTFDKIRELLDGMEKKQLAIPGGFYTANIMVGQGRMDDALIERVASDLESVREYAKGGTLVWSPLTKTVERWRKEYGGKAFRVECGKELKPR